MPEAEDVIVDIARHATEWAQRLWRSRAARSAHVDVPHLLRRIELLLTAVFGQGYALRPAQAPLPPTIARRLLRREERPWRRHAIPATDGRTIWLPLLSFERLQVMGLQQAMRAARRSVCYRGQAATSLQRVIFEVLEANAADAELVRMLPGVEQAILAHRAAALQQRPAHAEFSAQQAALEAWVRHTLESAPPAPCAPEQSLLWAAQFAHRLLHEGGATEHTWLYRDTWTGDLLEPSAQPPTSPMHDQHRSARHQQRSAHLLRRPEVRQPDARDDAERPGAWMIQTTQPMEHAEDPFGLQRPTDGDAAAAADEYADSVSGLNEARLVSSPGTTKEVLLSDEPPAKQTVRAVQRQGDESSLSYPEWDYRRGRYRLAGATVRPLPCGAGSRDWVDTTLAKHRSLLQVVQRQFESLQSQRLRLHQQHDGEELDLAACVDGLAELRAGAVLTRGLYQTCRPARQDLAVLLLVDVSGSTDAWVAGNRRVIDVEREALLLVCIALEALRERYSVLGFSGEGPHAVTVRAIKHFEEPYGDAVALRIAGLEPELFTRAGAALRHAAAALTRQPVRHRLLLLLSDGRPNDVDEYDGRYGVEDMRQAVAEARSADISVFCLTVERQLPGYLHSVFGESGYAVLQKPEALGTALLVWLRRLIAAA